MPEHDQILQERDICFASQDSRRKRESASLLHIYHICPREERQLKSEGKQDFVEYLSGWRSQGGCDMVWQALSRGYRNSSQSSVAFDV